jgi:hypothetical protein
MRNLGCAVVHRDTNGLLTATEVGRAPILDLIGSIDEIQAPLLKGKPTSGTLHVVSGTLRDGSSEYSVNCLADLELSHATFQQRLAASASRPVWRNVISKMQPHEGDASKPTFVLASDVLLASIRGNAAGELMGTRRSISNASGVRGPRYTLECGPGTNFACGVPTMPTVSVTATPGYPVVIDLAWLVRNERIYSLSDLMGVYFFGGPDCSNASETWLALNEVLNNLDAEIASLERATNALASAFCEDQYTANGQRYCIDLFIASETAGLIFEGDNREFDRYELINASRAQLYFDPATCTATAYVNTSRTVGFGPIPGGGPQGPHRLNRFTATPTSAGCVIEWTLYNGWCEGHVPTLVCPPIDGKLTVTSSGAGGWTANIEEDRYPSRGLYKWNGSSGWQTISERSEGRFTDLASRRQHRETIRISRDQSLPAGCNLQ